MQIFIECLAFNGADALFIVWVIQLISWAFTGMGVSIIILPSGASAVLVYIAVYVTLWADTTLRCGIPDLKSWTQAVSCAWVIDQPRTAVTSAGLDIKNLPVIGTLQIAHTLTCFIIKMIAIRASFQPTLACALLLVQCIRMIALLIADTLTPFVVKPIVSGACIQSAYTLTLLIQHIIVFTLPVADALTATGVKVL